MILVLQMILDNYKEFRFFVRKPRRLVKKTKIYVAVLKQQRLDLK